MNYSDSDSDSYAGSAASITAIEEQSEHKITQAIELSFDPLPLDKALVIEARHSGILNAYKQELDLKLKQVQEISRKYPQLQTKFDKLLHATQRNLKWLDEHIKAIETKLKIEYPVEFAQAEEEIM